VPVRESVQSVCEMLGYDPYFLACEGRIRVVIASEDADRALAAMQALPSGRDAAIIGPRAGAARPRDPRDHDRRRARARRTRGRPVAGSAERALRQRPGQSGASCGFRGSRRKARRIASAVSGGESSPPGDRKNHGAVLTIGRAQAGPLEPLRTGDPMTEKRALGRFFFLVGNPALEEVALIRIALRQAVALMRMILDARPLRAIAAAKLRFTEIFGNFPSPRNRA